MNSPTAKIPNTVQPGIDPDVYRKLSAHPQCSRLGKPCAAPCQPQNEDGTYDVEIDHIIPRSRGGSNEIDNLQWLCKCENRAKYNKPESTTLGICTSIMRLRSVLYVRISLFLAIEKWSKNIGQSLNRRLSFMTDSCFCHGWSGPGKRSACFPFCLASTTSGNILATAQPGELSALSG